MAPSPISGRGSAESSLRSPVRAWIHVVKMSDQGPTREELSAVEVRSNASKSGYREENSHARHT